MDQTLDRDSQRRRKITPRRGDPGQHTPLGITFGSLKKNRLTVITIDGAGHLEMGVNGLSYLNQMASRASLGYGITKVHMKEC
jgi:hypothetical protein